MILNRELVNDSEFHISLFAKAPSKEMQRVQRIMEESKIHGKSLEVYQNGIKVTGMKVSNRFFTTEERLV